jgi:secreted trypsin-like serine protease
MLTQISRASAMVLSVIAIILILALTTSIALVFTVGQSNKNNNGNNEENQSSGISLFEPCECGCPTIRPQITPRIVNGEAAVLNSWPWQLLLVNFSYTGVPRRYCGASLITSKHVLTAAHCVVGLSPRYVGVIPRLHTFNVSTWFTNISYIAQRVYVHESFDDRSGVDDIAVIRLRTPIPLDDYVSPVCLSLDDSRNEKLISGDELVATGWGALEGINRTSPQVLQQVRLQYVLQSDSRCARLIGSGESASPGQMCAGFPPHAICYGDSGGPLLRSVVHPNGQTYWQQIGIMSGTVDCGSESNYPDIYTRVSHYNSWILDKIRASP